MKIYQTLLFAAAVASASNISTAAQAAVMTATYTGVVSSGSDTTGEFGVPWTSLTGLGFTAQFTYDTSIGSLGTVPDRWESLDGGPILGGATPMLSATLTIRDVTFQLPLDGYVQIFAGIDQAQHVLTGSLPTTPPGPNNGAYINLSALTPGGPWSVFQSTPPLATTGGGNFKIVSRDELTAQYVQFAEGQLDVRTYAVSEAPEPAEWALLLLGFGVTGMSLRRKRPWRSPLYRA